MIKRSPDSAMLEYCKTGDFGICPDCGIGHLDIISQKSTETEAEMTIQCSRCKKGRRLKFDCALEKLRWK